MPTTSRLALPYPAGTEPASIPLDFQELADRLAAVAAGWLPSNTLANRPAPTAALDRHLFYAYDTEETFICVDPANDGSWTWADVGSGAQVLVQPGDPADPVTGDPSLDEGTMWYDEDEPDPSWAFDASAVVTGVFAVARIPDLTAYPKVDRSRNPVPLRTVRSGKDANGIFTTVEQHRVGGNLAERSVLSGGASPQYTTRTVTEYGTDGVTVLRTTVYTLTYDGDGDLTTETVA